MWPNISFPLQFTSFSNRKTVNLASLTRSVALCVCACVHVPHTFSLVHMCIVCVWRLGMRTRYRAFDHLCVLSIGI